MKNREEETEKVLLDVKDIKQNQKLILKTLEEIHLRELKKDIWLDNQGVMEKLHISPRTLQNWRDNGVIPFTKTGNKIWYLESDIDNMLRSNLQNKAS